MSFKSTEFFAGRLPRLAMLFAMVTAAPVAWSQHEFDDAADDQGPIRIGSNENAFGYSPAAMMAMMEALGDINRYARDEAVAFVQAISRFERVPTNHIITTAGSGPVLLMTALAYAEPGKNMITVTPGYLQLSSAFERAGGEVRSIPLTDDLVHDLDAMKAAIDENTVLVYICNPNNPTGTVVDPDELRAFIRSVPSNILVFVDEAYLELADGGLEAHSMINMVRQGHNVLISRTFSKVYGMAGLRAGYGIASPEVLARLRPFHMGGPNLLALVGATAAMQDEASFAENVERYRNTRLMVTEALDGMGVKYADAQGSFVFIHTGIPVERFQSLMEERNILVGRPFPPKLDWARVSIGTEEEMMTFIRVFREIMTAEGRLASR